MRGELETEQRLQHIDTHTSGYNSISLPFSWAAQPGAWGLSLCWGMVLIPASSLQLIWTSCCRDYIIIWHPPTSRERHNSHSIQSLDSQGRPLISSTGCTCYLHRCISSFDSLAGSEVNMQQHSNLPLEKVGKERKLGVWTYHTLRKNKDRISISTSLLSRQRNKLLVSQKYHYR